MNKHISLQPRRADGDQALSITLNWGDETADLDAHMIYAPLAADGTAAVDLANGEEISQHYTDFHSGEASRVYWMDQGHEDVAPYITLDIDEMFGKGPETITIHSMEDGHYKYFVKCYSCPPTAGIDSIDTAFMTGETSVIVSQNGQQRSLPTADGGSTWEYRITDHASGEYHRVWDVFSIHVSNGQVTMLPSLQFTQYEPSFKNGEQRKLEADLLSTSEDLKAAKMEHYRKNGGGNRPETTSGAMTAETAKMEPAVDLVQEGKPSAAQAEEPDILTSVKELFRGEEDEPPKDIAAMAREAIEADMVVPEVEQLKL